MGSDVTGLFEAQVAVISQRPLLAPGASLRQQLTYPCVHHEAVSHRRLQWLLSSVHLEHLQGRIKGDWDEQYDWTGVRVPSIMCPVHV